MAVSLEGRPALEPSGLGGAPSVRHGHWRPVPLFISLSIAVVFGVTWLLPTTRASWDAFDLLVFRLLNNTLSLGGVWQQCWAFANWRGFDLISGTAMLAALCYAMSQAQDRTRLEAWTSLALFAVLLFGQIRLTEFVIDSVLTFHRPSPTLTLTDTWRLSELVPDIACKDASPWSFPGDHGIVLISLALYVSYWASREAIQTVWWLALMFSVPRVIAGAHWPTDILVGSGCVALVGTAVLMATPLHDWLIHRLLRRWTRPKGRAIDASESEPRRGPASRAA